MWGIVWTFAHNGEVPKYASAATNASTASSGGDGNADGGNSSSISSTQQQHPYRQYPLLASRSSYSNFGKCVNDEDSAKQMVCYYHPVGDTDSEATFCAILNALRSEFTELPTLPVLYETLQRLCGQIVEGDEDGTILNFLLGCGPYTLFAYSWPGARPGSKVWNGLFYTIRRPPFATARLADVDYSVDFSKVTNPNDRVAVIATAPLTVDEEWKEFKKGQLLMFDYGLSYSELYDCLAVEKQGRGLYSKALPKKNCPCGTTGGVGDDGTDTYDLPVQLFRLVAESIGKSGDRCLSFERGADLGCGAGLSGRAFRSCCEHLTGVDLSPEMVDKARECGWYDELVVGDIECILRKSEEARLSILEREGTDVAAPTAASFDLVFACNVFSYVQDLGSVFRAVRRNVSDGGVFAFSAEVLEGIEQTESSEDNEEKKTNRQQEEDGDVPGCSSCHCVLQSCARYAHKMQHIEDLARECGFAIAGTKVSDPLRKHEGRDVNGLLAVMVATSGGGGGVVR